MATTFVLVEEYLRTSSKPERDYVHGFLKERALLDRDHAARQSALIQWFSQHKLEWGIYAFAELRVQMALDHVRIRTFPW
jgi:hypothetical protein